MLCPICHQREGEWQCQVCRRIVCTNDSRPAANGVFCVEHAPGGSSPKQPTTERYPKEESSSLKAVKGGFLTVLFLTIGLGIIVYLGQSFVNQFGNPADPSLGSIRSTLESLQSVGNLILYFMIFLTAILGFATFALSRQKS